MGARKGAYWSERINHRVRACGLAGIWADVLGHPLSELDSILPIIVAGSSLVEELLIGFTIVMIVVVVMTVTMMTLLLCVLSHISVDSVDLSAKLTPFYTV